MPLLSRVLRRALPARGPALPLRPGAAGGSARHGGRLGPARRAARLGTGAARRPDQTDCRARTVTRLHGMTSVSGVDVSTVDVRTADGVADALLAVPTGEGRWPGVLLFMDAFGLRPRLQD